MKLANKLIYRAHHATNVGRVVFLGNPPQHFKAESGEYAGPEAGECMCHDRAAMQKQPIFAHNEIVRKEVRKENERSADGTIAFASPWGFYADKCTTHGHMYGHAWNEDKVYCTHWLECDVASHAPFLKDSFVIAGMTQLLSHCEGGSFSLALSLSLPSLALFPLSPGPPALIRPGRGMHRSSLLLTVCC